MQEYDRNDAAYYDFCPEACPAMLSSTWRKSGEPVLPYLN